MNFGQRCTLLGFMRCEGYENLQSTAGPLYHERDRVLHEASRSIIAPFAFESRENSRRFMLWRNAIRVSRASSVD